MQISVALGVAMASSDDKQQHAGRDHLRKLSKKKNDIENEIKQLGIILDSQKNVGMHAPLVDAEGYPRIDIDIYQVRHARHRIICLQNDHKALMKEIEEALHDFHAHHKPQTNEVDDVPMQDDGFQITAKPFAKVDKVSMNSPAENAGLFPGDLIIKFGSITPSNFTNLQSIAAIVQHSIGKPVHLTVLRNETPVHISLTPSTWSGKGLLGCNLLPFT